jgi:aarF domain-containing kinase
MLLAIGGMIYGYDRQFNASAISRSTRAAYNLLYVGLDYKLNFKEGQDIEELHQRSADRIYNVLIKNKGLYIKLGQMVAIQQGIFPKSFQEKFQQLFDSAPQDSWKDVKAILTKELKLPPDEYFESIDHRAVASASIAQVYKAKLKTGETVAVKVQHAELEKQIWWDLQAYKGVMYIFDRYLFNFPLYFIAEHVAERLNKEVNFIYEAQNSESIRNAVLADRTLGDKVYVPRIFGELCTERVLVTEWIDGVRMTNKQQIKAEKYNVPKIINTLMHLYGLQIFHWGTVHCDPHPGNIILRRVKGTEQIVLIDHGLHISETEKFRHEYASLWQGIFMMDMERIQETAKSWGFGNSSMFSNAIFRGDDATTLSDMELISEEESQEQRKKREFEKQEKARDMFQGFFEDTTKMPLELIFLGRTMRILQGINKMFDSPVNRIKIFAWDASSVLTSEIWLNKSWRGKLKAWRDYFVFLSVVTFSEVNFYLIRLRQIVFRSSRGIEDLIEQQQQSQAKGVGITLTNDINLEE